MSAFTDTRTAMKPISRQGASAAKSKAGAKLPRTSAAAHEQLRDWQLLCEELGERRAGSAAERQAAAYIADQWTAAGLSVVVEPFACTHMAESIAEVHAPGAGEWERVEAAPLVGTPSTPGGKLITGELAWLEMPEGSHRLRPRSLRGRILALFGPLPTDAGSHRRLVAAEPAAVIHIDERLPFDWVKNDGLYPYWVKRYGVPVTLTVPYVAAWRWRRDGVSRLRVRVSARPTPGESQNVVGELTGTDPRRPAVVVTAHHDTQCGNPGADDNASGVICLLALARYLAARATPLRRTVRFVSFGTEEQLSVGADVYVKRHRITRRDAGVVVNFDSVASPLGHFVLWLAGSAALERRAVAALRARGVDVALRREVSPFFDHFPFNRAGVPSLTFMRENFPGGRWQHHSRHDTFVNISRPEVHRLLDAVAPLIEDFANARRSPFDSGLPKTLHARARQLGRDLLGA